MSFPYLSPSLWGSDLLKVDKMARQTDNADNTADNTDTKKPEPVTLKSHQQLPVRFMNKNRGLILYHSTGSGKTITALSAMTQHPDPVIVIGRKSSRKAFQDDIKKLDLKTLINVDSDSDMPRYMFYTFTKIKTLLEDNLDMLNGFSVIVDEAHTLRNETTPNLMIIGALGLAKRVMLLTATPVINYLNDLCVLVNIAKNDNILPTDINTFNAAYYNSRNNTIENQDILIKKLSECISHYDHYKNSEDYPSYETEYVEVEMIHEQLLEYKKYIRKYFFDVQLEYRGTGQGEYYVDFGDTYVRAKNYFLNATRQLSNTLDGRSDFPKIDQMHKMILEQKEKKLTPMIVYSNYLENGVYALTKLLERDDLTYKTITGNSTDEKINFIVNDYNKGKVDVLLITSAGSESLDLKNTRIIHIMEPHWNESRIKQVIGRAIRFRSHSDLPKAEQNVKIFRWSSVFPDTIANKSADTHLIEISRNKDEIFKVFDELIIDAAIENKNYNKYSKPVRKMSRSRVTSVTQEGGHNTNYFYDRYIANRTAYQAICQSYPL